MGREVERHPGKQRQNYHIEGDSSQHIKCWDKDKNWKCPWIFS